MSLSIMPYFPSVHADWIVEHDATMFPTSRMERWDRDVFMEMQGWVMVNGNQVRGVCLYECDADSWHLCYLAIHPQFQQRGCGTRLLKQFLSTAKRRTKHVTLCCESHNTIALKLYTQFGFKQTKTHNKGLTIEMQRNLE